MKRTQILPTLIALLALALAGCGQQEGAVTALPAEAPPDAPDLTVLWVAEAASAGDMARVWDAMPVSYQRDVTKLVQQFGYAVDVEAWEKSFRIMDKTATLMETKKDFILGHPVVEQQQNTSELAAEWEPMVEALRSLARSRISTASGLRTLDVRAFLATTGRELAAQGDRFASLTPMPRLPDADQWKLAATQVEVLEESDRNARVQIELPERESPEVIELTRVDGRWVPSEMAAEWDQGVARLQAELEEMAAGSEPSFPPDARTMLPVLEGALDALLETTSQEEFNAVVEQKVGAMLMQELMRNQGASGVES